MVQQLHYRYVCICGQFKKVILLLMDAVITQLYMLFSQEIMQCSHVCNTIIYYCTVGLWELCSKFPSLLYSKFLSISLYYVHYSFYAAPSIIIPYLQFKFYLYSYCSLFPIYNLNYQSTVTYLILHAYLAICSHTVMYKQHNNY